MSHSHPPRRLKQLWRPCRDTSLKAEVFVSTTANLVLKMANPRAEVAVDSEAAAVEALEIVVDEAADVAVVASVIVVAVAVAVDSVTVVAAGALQTVAALATTRARRPPSKAVCCCSRI